MGGAGAGTPQIHKLATGGKRALPLAMSAVRTGLGATTSATRHVVTSLVGHFLGNSRRILQLHHFPVSINMIQRTVLTILGLHVGATLSLMHSGSWNTQGGADWITISWLNSNLSNIAAGFEANKTVA
jgi:hypothetical protein